jgi:hypothetical protein
VTVSASFAVITLNRIGAAYCEGRAMARAIDSGCPLSARRV